MSSEYSWWPKSLSHDCEQVLTKLDPAIRQKIREELYVTIVARHPFFAQISPEALRYLCGTVHVILAIYLTQGWIGGSRMFGQRNIGISVLGCIEADFAIVDYIV